MLSKRSSSRAVLLAALIAFLPLAHNAVIADEKLPGVAPSYTISGLKGAPTRLALNGAGLLYVTCGWERIVQEVDQNGNLIDEFAPSVTKCPVGVAVLPAGELALSDVSRGAVDVYNSSHQYVRSLGVGAGEFVMPSDLACDLASGKLYIADSGAAQVRVFSLGGRSTKADGEVRLGGGNLVRPTGIALAQDGQTVFVSDMALGQVRKFQSTGSYLGNAGSRGSFSGQFIAPPSVAVDQYGNMCVADTFLNTVQVLEGTDGSYVASLGEMALSPGEGLLQPSDVALDTTTKKLFVASHNTGVIEVFNVAGILPIPSRVLDWRLGE